MCNLLTPHFLKELSENHGNYVVKTTNLLFYLSDGLHYYDTANAFLLISLILII